MRGTVLLDSLIGLTLLALAAVSFFSFFPVVHRTSVISSDEAKATQIAQRMLERVQLLSPTSLNASALTSLGLIDTGQNASPYTFNTISADNSTNYSPSKTLRNGTGVMTVQAIANGSYRVSVVVGWKSESGANRSISLGTIVGGYRP